MIEDTQSSSCGLTRLTSPIDILLRFILRSRNKLCSSSLPFPFLQVEWYVGTPFPLQHCGTIRKGYFSVQFALYSVSLHILGWGRLEQDWYILGFCGSFSQALWLEHGLPGDGQANFIIPVLSWRTW